MLAINARREVEAVIRKEQYDKMKRDTERR